MRKKNKEETKDRRWPGEGIHVLYVGNACMSVGNTREYADLYTNSCVFAHVHG